MRLNRNERTSTNGGGRMMPRLAAGGLMFVAVMGVFAVSEPASAQGWWPWATQQEPPPRPREPVYRAPPPGQVPGGPPGPFPGPGAGGGRSNICLQLEQRLVAEVQKSGSPQDALPKIDQDFRLTERQLGQAQMQLERGECYEYFLFTKTLRNTPHCRGAAGQVDGLKRRLSELEAQRQQIVGSSDRRFRDDMVRELARNGCGANWVQEARKLDGGGGGGFWTTEEDPAPRGGNQFGTLPFATYRTVCVRLCDGYYFPVSFSTLPNHFQRDADLCQSRCAAPVELYYHQNPGGGMEQAVSAKAQTNYSALKTAFKYRKEYVQGCSCKEAEFQPAAEQPKRADGAPGAGSTSASVPQRAVPRGSQQN